MGDPMDWTEPRFLADAHAWIRERLGDLDMRLTGPVEQIHDRPWSTVLRVPTDRGDQFFKASAPALGHEAAIVAFLAERLPEVIPAPLAVDLEQGWMLMADAGIRLRELVEAERDVSRWLDVLPLYAGLQVELAGAAADLLRLGAPDMRLAVLPARYEALLDELVASDAMGELDRLEAAGGGDRPGVPAALPSDEMRRLRHAVPRVAAMCMELAGYGLAETIQHDDLNDGAVYARDGRYLILDWGDACVSHPFFSMSVTLEGVIGWGVDDVQGSVDVAPFRDAYLAPFAGDRTGEELRAACALAVRLGWVCRAVNGHVPGIDATSTWTRLRMFLDGHA